MRELEARDVLWVERRLPKHVRNLLKDQNDKLFLAGGFIRSCVLSEEPKDIDLFTDSKVLALGLATTLASREPAKTTLHETENAITVLGFGVSVQFIHRWTFETPRACVESFDFTIASAAFWYDGDRIAATCCDDRFYADLAAKRLTYRAPVRNEDAGGSLLRVLKFVQRGYRIPLDSFAAVMARMVSAVDFGQIEEGHMGREPQIAKVLCGLLKEVDPNSLDFADVA